MKFSLQSTVLFLLIGIACTATTTTATAASATEAQNRVRSIRVSGRIASNDVLKFPVELGTNTRVVLDLDPKMSVPVQADGRFTLYPKFIYSNRHRLMDIYIYLLFSVVEMWQLDRRIR